MAVHQVAVQDRSPASFPATRTGSFRAAAAPSARRRRQSFMRRRQIVLVLVGLTGIALVAAVGSGATAAWWAVLVTVSVGSGYLALLHHIRRVMARREFAALFAPTEVDLSSWRELRLPPVTPEQQPSAAQPSRQLARRPPRTGSGAWALARFVLANVAGWALSPLVFALTLLLGKTPRDTTGQRWLANLQAAQTSLREQSLRTLAISAATTASVTAAGTVAALTGTASAAPLPVSAAMSAGPGLSGLASGSMYQVVAGDTLWAIAERFGTTVAALTAANQLTDPNLIYPGEVLTLPAGITPPSPDTAARPSATIYRVVAGDTLWAIAERFGTTVAALTAANQLTDPNLIYLGEVLTLPGATTPSSGTTVTPSSTPRPDSHPAARPATTAAETAVRAALAQVGKPYQWGGAGPESFDCSGLVMYAWGQAGVSLPHYSVAQYEDTVRISRSQLEPGDLVFYDNGDGGPQPGHVTMYIGDGQIVTADEPGTVVRVEVVDWDGIPMGYGQVR